MNASAPRERCAGSSQPPVEIVRDPIIGANGHVFAVGAGVCPACGRTLGFVVGMRAHKVAA